MQSAGVLVAGTGVAQLLAIAVLPLLTRIYEPGDFEVFAAFLAAHNVLAVIACLRFEIAIPVARDDGDARRLTLLAAGSATVLALTLAAVLALAGDALLAAVRLTLLRPYLLLLPLSMWLAGIYAATQYWATRQRRYAAIARTRVLQTGSGSLAQLGLGLAKNGPVGLLVGQLLIAGAGAAGLVRIAVADGVLSHLRDGRRKFAGTLHAFRRFPQYSTLEAFANRGAGEIPLLIIAAFALGPEAGFVLLAIKVMGAPISLIGNAVTQAFLADARDEEAGGSLARFVEQTLVRLALIGTGPILFIGIVAPIAFGIIFGADWTRAGAIVTWMTGWSLFKFLTSPISGVLHVQMRQRAMALLQIAGFAARVAATLVAAYTFPARMAESFAIASGVFYLACLLIYASAAEVRWSRIARSAPLIALITLAWAALGLAVVWAAPVLL